MNIRLDYSVAAGYKSPSQIARVVTETWVGKNMFCPVCGRPLLTHEKANEPVADFHCDDCQAVFELKAMQYKGKEPTQVTDGEYSTMMKRLQAIDNPNLLVMTYTQHEVRDLIFTPKYFFVPDVIIPRKPLPPKDRRAGWQGCNIRYKDISTTGKIYIIKDFQEVDRRIVLESYKRTTALRTTNIESRGWLMDVLSCVERIPTEAFSLQQVYAFANELQAKHPANNFVEAKIRQQLQYLRDSGFIEFTARGQYRRITF